MGLSQVTDFHRSTQTHAPRQRLDFLQNCFDEGGFASAIGSDQRHPITSTDLRVGAVEEWSPGLISHDEIVRGQHQIAGAQVRVQVETDFFFLGRLLDPPQPL